MKASDILDKAHAIGVCGEVLPHSLGAPNGYRYARPVYSEELVAFYVMAHKDGQLSMQGRAAGVCLARSEFERGTGLASTIRELPLEELEDG